MKFELLIEVMDRFLNLRDTNAARIRAYPTGRLFWGGAVPRHFVPGYNRTVPPGHFATGFSLAVAAVFENENDDEDENDWEGLRAPYLTKPWSVRRILRRSIPIFKGG